MKRRISRRFSCVVALVVADRSGCLHWPGAGPAALTLALPKVGLLQSKARPYVGQVCLADTSVRSGLYTKLGLSAPALFAEGPLGKIDTLQENSEGCASQ